jgi:hypothetical protein
MRQAIANYWWGSSVDNKHVHLMKWDHLTKPKCEGGMGFRDMRMFNLAMLGKQGWRLMTRPDSLCSQVLKGRYFHDSDFMACSRNKNASCTWRAILAGKEALNPGFIKRIGSGVTTHIWEDWWIPQHMGGKPLTPAKGQEYTLVNELLTDSGGWNEDRVREIFFSIDANAILRIPVRGREDDLWVWEPEKHGMYMVRSAYKLLHKLKSRKKSIEVQGQSRNDDRKRIWKLDVPPKVKVFWWRVIHEFLPTKYVLHKRHIEPEAHCETCGVPEESIRHVLLE